MFVLGIDVDEASPGQLDALSVRLLALMETEDDTCVIWRQLQVVWTAYVKVKLHQALEEYLQDYGDEFVYHQEATGSYDRDNGRSEIVDRGTNYWFTLSIGRFSFSVVLRATSTAFSEARFALVSGTREGFQALQRPFRDCIRIIIQACSKQMSIDTNILQRNFDNMIANL